jgi:nucleoside-diphosphate-sugar epimerase
MRVVVTGNQGYLGGVLTPMLQMRGHEVVGMDSGIFADCLFAPASDVPTVRCDLRDVTADVVRGADAVVHLAALSNDPLGSLDAELTRQINLGGTVRLAELSKAVGVRRFVFASSCIIYGTVDGGLADENGPLAPETAYAGSKLAAEQALAWLADDTFSPVYLRNGTVYGAAPRMRLDTVFNDLLAAAVATGTAVVRGDGQTWRPIVDIRDVAKAFVAATEAPAEAVHNEAFNIGADQVNHQVLELAQRAASLVEGASLRLLGEPGHDRRSYRANFEKCGRVFPELRFRTIEEGGRDLVGALRAFGEAELGAARHRFVRIDRIHRLLGDGRLDRSLRWNAAPS